MNNKLDNIFVTMYQKIRVFLTIKGFKFLKNQYYKKPPQVDKIMEVSFQKDKDKEIRWGYVQGKQTLEIRVLGPWRKEGEEEKHPFK